MDLQSATAAELYRFLEASWRGTTWVGRATFQTAQRLHALMMDSNRPSGIPADWESEGGSATSRGIPARRALLLPLRASLQEARRIGRLALDGAHKIRVALVRDPPPIDDGWEMINDSSSSEDGTAEINNHGWDDNGGLFDDEPLSSGYVLADTISNHNSSSEDDEQPPSRRVSAPLDLPADLSLSRDPPTNPWTSSQPIHQDSELREHVEQNRTPRTTMKGTPQPPTPPRRPAEQRKQPSAPMAASDNPRTPHPATGPHQKERREAQSTDGATQPAQQPDGRLTSDEVLERLRGRLATRGPRPGASRARSRPAWVPCDGHELVDAGLRARIGEAKRRARGGGKVVLWRVRLG
ncbi:hypothetical protein B0I37DRAFT_90174 [Chaetomium sp. MPI-CAGE-AT-0009]|nr:hypothetical protein B0I37DRAFT_90174 [Chaetomium sp. MPI-CAGE-AT-0009]